MEVSVPGKVMLAGEYAVLKGANALAATLDTRLVVKVIGKESSLIHSNIWAEPKIPCEDELMSLIYEEFDNPVVSLDISSELSPSYGIGSSSAVTLGVATALNAITHRDMSLKEICELSYKIQKKYQDGVCSGYDIWTQANGGCGVFSPELKLFNRVPTPKVKIFIGGSGANTKKTVHENIHFFDDHELWDELREKSEYLINHIDDEFLIDAVKEIRGVLSQSPSYPKEILDPLKKIRGCDQTWSYKTSGAGGEDALLFFGDVPHDVNQYMNSLGWEELPHHFSEDGVSICQM